MTGYHDVVPVNQDLQKRPPERLLKTYQNVPLDPELKALAAKALQSQADFDTVNAQANSLQSTLALDNVAIENAKLQLQYTKIYAPVTGRTGALQVHEAAHDEPRRRQHHHRREPRHGGRRSRRHPRQCLAHDSTACPSSFAISARAAWL